MNCYNQISDGERLNSDDLNSKGIGLMGAERETSFCQAHAKSYLLVSE